MSRIPPDKLIEEAEAAPPLTSLQLLKGVLHCKKVKARYRKRENKNPLVRMVRHKQWLFNNSLPRPNAQNIKKHFPG